MDMDQEERRRKLLSEVEASIKEIDKATASLPKKFSNFFRKAFGKQVSSSIICVQAWNLQMHRAFPQQTPKNLRVRHCLANLNVKMGAQRISVKAQSILAKFGRTGAVNYVLRTFVFPRFFFSSVVVVCGCESYAPSP